MAGRFEIIAARYLNIIVDGDDEKMCECPFCKGSASLQFNVDTGLWLCFRCDAKGNSPMLVKRLGGTYTDPAVSIDAILETIDRMKIRAKLKEQGPTILDESALLRYQFNDDYWINRGFSQSTIDKWSLGFDPIKNRHTIPIREPNGDLLGVIQRLSDDEANEAGVRYIYQKTFDRKGSLFGSWKVESERVCLVEGATDAIALDDVSIPAVAQYGSSTTQPQVRLLHRLGIKEIVLFFDYDEAGRKAEEKAREVLEGFILRTVIWDENKYCWREKRCGCGQHTWRTIAKCEQKYKCKCGRRHGMDPNSLSPKERKKMHKKAVLVGRVKKWQPQKYAK